jgi:hypothetical protein
MYTTTVIAPGVTTSNAKTDVKTDMTLFTNAIRAVWMYATTVAEFKNVIRVVWIYATAVPLATILN